MSHVASQEGRLAIWRRRVISIPGLLGLTALSTCLGPTIGCAALARDTYKRDWRLPTLRACAAMSGNLWIHTAGLAWLTGIWLRTELLRRGGAAEDASRSYRAEVGLSRALTALVEWTFGARVEVEGLDVLGDEPVLILARHCSLVDPVLLLAVTAVKGTRIRYVAKRELLWDPCVDVLGHRLPMAFVWRKGRARERDLLSVHELSEHMGPRDALLVFPEGTRFSDDKLRHALAVLRERHPGLAVRAGTLRHVLPPHPGGVRMFIRDQPECDVIVCAHTGLEGISHLRDFFDGALLDRTIRMKLWRIPHQAVPREADQQLAWLYDVMDQIDAWVDDNARDSTGADREAVRGARALAAVNAGTRRGP